MDSRLTLVGAVLFVAGTLLLALLLGRILRRISFRGEKANRIPPKSPRFWQVLIAIILIVIAQGFFWLSSQLEYFRPLPADGHFAQLRVEHTGDPVQSLDVQYVPLAPESTGLPNRFFLSGDSWRFFGEVIDFKFARKYLHLPERAYKTVRFEGRFLGRLPQHASGALLNENLLEGGSSQAFRLFRDSRYLKWFARVDSFSTDYVITEKIDSIAVKLEPDGTVGLEAQRPK